MSDEERRNWEKWAYDNLVEVQHLLDEVNYAKPSHEAAELDRQQQLKTELTDTADELVQVHGLLHAGYIDQADAAIKRLEQRAAHARALACTKS